MLIRISDLSALRRYADGVRDRADHHAANVTAIWPCLLGYALAFADDPNSIEVRPRRSDSGEMALQAWGKFGGQRISFSYQHASASIVARRGARVLKSFTNATSAPELERFFRQLSVHATSRAAA